jgi:hypothetical protein
MKLVGIISTAVVSLALGASVPMYAQQEQHDQQEEDKAKPAQDEKKAQPEKPAKQEEKSAQQENKNNQQEEKKAEQPNKNSQQEEKNASQQENTKQQENAKQNEKNVTQQEHSQQAKTEQHEQNASNGGGRIPEDRYKANFGSGHRFRVTQSDYSNRRFQYGGYWFGFQGAWPSNWLYTQDVFVVEIDGVYYLCNANYPGVNIVLSVTL